MREELVEELEHKKEDTKDVAIKRFKILCVLSMIGSGHLLWLQLLYANLEIQLSGLLFLVAMKNTEQYLKLKLISSIALWL